MYFLCFQINQKPDEIFERISVLASKKRPNQKSSVRAKIKCGLFVCLFYWTNFEKFNSNRI